MYDRTVTVFVNYESKTANVWYPFVLSGVDLNTDRGAILKKYGADSTDNAELHVACVLSDGNPYIKDASGDFLPYLTRKEWEKQTNDNLAESITFGAGDFIMLGEWTGGIVNDDDYTDRRYQGFYAYLNDLYDNVYMITSVSSLYTVIPHLEILGK